MISFNRKSSLKTHKVIFNQLEAELLHCVCTHHQVSQSSKVSLSELYRLVGHLENSDIEDYPELKANCQIMFKFVINEIVTKVNSLIAQLGENKSHCSIRLSLG